MAFLMIRIEAPALTVGNINQKLVNSDANAIEGVVALRNLCDALLAGAVDAQVDIAVRSTTQAITAAGGGIDATYNLK